MKPQLHKISMVLYGVVAILATMKAVQLWQSDRQQAYLFTFFAVFSVFMILFRNRYYKKFKAREEQNKK